MKTKTIIPLCSLVLAVFWIIYGLTHHGFWHPVKGPITGFVPILVSIPLVPASIAAMINSFKEKDSPEPLETWSIALAAGITFCLVFLIGMIIALMIFVFIWVRIYEKSTWRQTIISLIVTFGIIYGVFGYWLQVPFPNGIVLDAILR